MSTLPLEQLYGLHFFVQLYGLHLLINLANSPFWQNLLLTQSCNPPNPIPISIHFSNGTAIFKWSHNCFYLSNLIIWIVMGRGQHFFQLESGILTVWCKFQSWIKTGKWSEDPSTISQDRVFMRNCIFSRKIRYFHSNIWK